MGIVNVTPDSFSGDGEIAVEAATAYALAQHTAGADVIDVGGESTRPGHETVAGDVEIARVVPVVRALRSRLPEIPISIDTYKAEVARAAHAAGADIVNSVWGAPADLLDVAAELEMPIVAMHNRHRTGDEGDVVAAVVAFLTECARCAQARGIPDERI